MPWQAPNYGDRPECATNIVVVMDEKNNFLLVPDRCRRWSCDHCRIIDLGKKVEHLFGKPDMAVLRDDDANLARRARESSAGYLRVWQPSKSIPMVVASAELYPYLPVMDPSKALMMLAKSVQTDGITRIVFNKTWRAPDKEATHTYITSSYESRKKIRQAIADAGLDGMEDGQYDLETIRRRINHRLEELDIEFLPEGQ